jgi:hypothetical protein
MDDGDGGAQNKKKSMLGEVRNYVKVLVQKFFFSQIFFLT